MTLRLLSLCIVIWLTSTPVFAQTKQTADPQVDKLAKYLRSHWKTPEAYVVSKFADHEIVFIGEYHRIKHDLSLIHKLIPRLHKARVYNLGIEFGCYEHQDKVDRLITADTYDENLARWLIFQGSSSWGYIEYEDIYRKAWELNKSLPKKAHKFRVVNLGYRPNWPARKEQMTPADWDNVWWQGDPDEHMAKVVLKEFVEKGQKALVYSGNHHAFTSYHQPIYDWENKKLVRFNTTRMGNLVYDKIKQKTFNIYLHAPWASSTSLNDDTRPVGGVIDAVMMKVNNRPVGFDVKGTPFGAVADDQSYYSLGYENFTLGVYCDGYIFQERLEDYVGVTVDPLFITEANLTEAVAYIANPEFRPRVKKPEDLIAAMTRSADIKRRFSKLK